MTDLSASAALRFMGEIFTEKWVVDNVAAHTFYKGQPMMLGMADTVYVHGFIAADTVASDDICVGIAAEDITVATTDTETDNVITVYTGPTIVGFKDATLTDASAGSTVYMTDSATLGIASATGDPQIGKLVRVVNGYAFVKLSTPQICASA